MDLLDDYYTVTLPLVDGAARTSLELVEPTSPRQLRDQVERFARYFLREMHTGGIQFEAAENPETLGYRRYAAYLFYDGNRYFGASCFRWREWEDAAASWSADWVWFHPYFRSQGHLTRAWPHLIAQHGHFHLAKPLSHGMRAFLN